jgi:hypothetical protein
MIRAWLFQHDRAFSLSLEGLGDRIRQACTDDEATARCHSVYYEDSWVTGKYALMMKQTLIADQQMTEQPAFQHILWDMLCFHFVLMAALCFHNRFVYSSLLIPNRLKLGSLRTVYASTR